MKKKRTLLLIPVAIICLSILLILGDEFIIKQRKLKQLKQNVTIACIEVYKSSISYYLSKEKALPADTNQMVNRLKESDLNTDSLESCLTSNPVEYQRRLNTSGYKLTYHDAWGKEQIEEVDFNTDYE